MKLKEKTRELTVFHEHSILTANTMMANPMKSLKLHNQLSSF